MEQGQHNALSEGQAQKCRDQDDAQSINHLQNPGILEETGTHVRTMAQGAADIGVGAAQGALGLARGAVLGVANITGGAATAVKNTLEGSNAESNTNANQIHSVGGTDPSGVNMNPNKASSGPSN